MLAKRLTYRALEPRIVFDGAGTQTFDAAAEPADASTAEEAANGASESKENGNALTRALTDQSTAQKPPANAAPDFAFGFLTQQDGATGDAARSEIAFIDSAVEDPAELMAGFHAGVEVIVLDADQDGVTQIVDALADRSDVSAIHILAHGSEGSLSLGSAVLDSNTLDTTYRDDLSGLKGALTESADILIYGCDFTAGENGVAAAEALARLTGADIAASNDLTGATDKGGDWDLETRVGSIEAQTAAVEGWGSVLADAPPTAQDDIANTTEDTRVIFNPLANDSDPEGDVFLTSFTQPASGDVSIAVGETGDIDVDSNGTTINLSRNYANPVVFVFTTTENESSAAPDIARISNITGNSFDLSIVEPNSGNTHDTTDGVHGLESVSYIVLEAGVWTLSDGTVVEVGTRDVSSGANGLTNVSFDHSFAAAPVVLSQVQTNNNGVDYNEARQRSVTASGFRVTNEPADYQSNAITVAESIGFLAISPGAGTWSGIDFEAGVTGDNVTHANRSISFAQDLGPDVNFLAQLHTLDGGDNAHVDARNLDGGGVSVSVQEDRTSDSEINHTTERVGWLALGGDGLLGAVSGTNLHIPSDNVQFIYTPGDDVTGADSFTYTIEDTAAQAATATVALNVTPEVDVADDDATTVLDTPVTFNVFDNDNFEGGVSLTAVSAPSGGSLTFDAVGNITYTPGSGFQGVELLTYTATEDTLGQTETGNIKIVVTGNTAPVATADDIAALEDAPVTFNPLANDSDAESDVFLTSFAQPPTGELELAVGEVGAIDVDSVGTTINLDKSYTNPVVFVFTTTENQTSTAPDIARVSNITGSSFDLRIVEPNSGAGTDTTDGVHGSERVSYIVLEAGVWTLADGTVVEVGTHEVATGANSFTNVAFNNAFAGTPVVLSQVQTDNNGIEFNEARQRDVTGTGYQVTNEPADYQSTAISTAETMGYLVIGQGTGQWSGLDFEAGVTADNITDSGRTIGFTNNLGPAPNFLAQLHTFDGGDNAHLDASGLSGTGVDVNVQEDRTLDSEVRHTTERAGWLALSGNGILYAIDGSDYEIASADVEFKYTPADDVNGAQAFSYSIVDIHANTTSGTATLNLSAEIDTVTDGVATIEETPVTHNVLANDQFEGPVTLAIVYPPANGSVVFDAAGNITYTPNTDFFGTETITYVVSEDTLGVTETGTLVVTVTNVNDAPLAAGDHAQAVSGEAVSVAVLANDTDPDGDSLSVVAASATNGRVTINADGTLTYQPGSGFVGTDVITYVIDDGNGARDEATVTVKVTAAPPVASPQAEQEDEPNPTGIVVDGTEKTTPSEAGIAVRASISADGAVLDALAEIAGGSALGRNSALSSLETSAIELTELRILELTGLLQPFAGFALSDGDLTTAGGYAFTFEFGAEWGGPHDPSRILLETLVRDRLLVIKLPAIADISGKPVAAVRLAGTDSRPAPGWLAKAGPSLYIGQRPADIETLSLRLVVEYQDGTTAERVFKVEAGSGKIEVAIPQRAAVAPQQFSDQFRPMEIATEAGLRELDRALNTKAL